MPKLLVRMFALLLVLWTPCTSEWRCQIVKGVVTDKSGNILGKVVVQLENDFDQSVRSYITGVDGRYHFAGINCDFDYTLRAHYREVWSKPKSLSRFDLPTRQEVRLVIPIQ